MSTADIAEGNATIGEVKWEVAKTTPSEEFCMPTCKEKPTELKQGKANKNIIFTNSVSE